jgi:hypothetical protein
MRKNSLTLFAVCATLLWAGAVVAQPFPGGLPRCEANLTQTQGLLRTCQTDLTTCQNKPTVVFPGDGYPNPDAYGVSGHGPALSYTDNGDGTFTDNSTLLMWEEKKAGSADVHDVSNTYTWSIGSAADDGTVFTEFLATLNTPPCFANHCDWRLPNVKELQSLVDYTQSNPAISSSVPGATQSLFYWSATTAPDPGGAWSVLFNFGYVSPVSKIGFGYVRAVRSGS